MTLEGDIQELQLIPRLLELGKEQFTGAIRFENVSVLKILYFKDGEILSASTNDRADSVDEILLRSGKVTRDHLKEALAKRQADESIGEALLSLGFVTKKELVWARRVQLVGVLRSLIGWAQGTFAIVPDYLPKRQEGTSFKIHQVILELLVTSDDRSAIEQQIDGGELVLDRTPDFAAEYATLDLNEEADAIAALVDGERTASDIAAASQRDSFTVYKLLAALQTLGLLTERTKPQQTLELLTFAPPPEPVSFGQLDFSMIAPASEASFSDEPAIEAEPEESRPVLSHSEPERSSRRVLPAALAVLFVLAAAGAAYFFRGNISDLIGTREDSLSASVAPPAVAPAAVQQPRAAASPVASSNVAPAEEVKTEPNVAERLTAPPAAPQPAVVAERPRVDPPKEGVVPKPPPARSPVATQAANDPLRARYDRMAADFARKQERGHYTVQFELVCQTDSVTKALDAGGSQVWFVPTTFQGKSCFRVFWGDYESRSDAERAITAIPASLRGTSRPAVVETR